MRSAAQIMLTKKIADLLRSTLPVATNS